MSKKLVFLLLSIIFTVSLCMNPCKVNAKEEELDYTKGRALTESEVHKQQEYVPKSFVTTDLPEQWILLQERHKVSQTSNPSMFSQTSLPSSYDSRAKGYITPVKDQGYTQWCWAYSIAACAETSMVKNKISVNGTISTSNNTDLSEGALVYYFFTRTITPDPLKLSVGDNNISLNHSSNLRDYGGNPLLSSVFLSTGMGMQPESYYSVNPYGSSHIVIPNPSDAYTSSSAILKNASFLSTDLDVKNAVMNYGAASVSIYYDDYFLNYNTAGYYFPYYEYGTNHAVTVVGWDDSYSKNNFMNGNSIPGDGAWIVKNSWSANWGDDGYFYLSYYDQSFMPMVALEMQKANTYDNNYFYDGSSALSYVFVDNNSYISNVFTAQSKEKLKAVSVAIYDSNITYELQIYKKLANSTNPTSGTAVFSSPVRGTFGSESGIMTIPLPESVSVSKGETYSVVIKLSSSIYSTINCGIEMNTNYGWIEFDVKTSAGVSYLSQRANNWIDLHNEYNVSLRIKVLSNNSTSSSSYTVTFKNGSKVVSTQSVKKGKDAVPPTVTKKGYTFSKWDADYTNITKDVVINAVWKANKYTVAFNANGGKKTMSTKTYTYGKSYSLPSNSFTRSNYSFIGWNTKKDGSGTWYKNKVSVKNLTSTNKKKVTLYAQWSKNTTISSLKNSSKGALTVTISTKTNSSQSGYQITYSTSKNFTSSKSVKLKGYKNTSKVITGLQKGKTYYVKVRTYKKVGDTTYYGKYSAYKKIKLTK